MRRQSAGGTHYLHPTNMTDGVWSDQARCRQTDGQVPYRGRFDRSEAKANITANLKQPWRDGGTSSPLLQNGPFHNVQLTGSTDSHYYLPHTSRKSRPSELQGSDALLCDTDVSYFIMTINHNNNDVRESIVFSPM